MGFITWTDELSVGMDEIDDQHKELVKMINQFYDDIASKSSNDNIVALIQKMADYTVYHFNTEEKYFADFNYKFTEEHKQAHAGFVSKVLDVQEKIRSGKLVVSFEITSFLRDWLREHIMGSDRKYIDLFKAKGIK